MDDLLRRLDKEELKKLVLLLVACYADISIEVYIRDGSSNKIVDDFKFKITTKGGLKTFIQFTDCLNSKDFEDVEDMTADFEIWFNNFSSSIDGDIKL